MINKLKKLGPGLLFAGAAIGVSHLVQSTRAGADFGFSLLWVLILSNIIKYPFFLFGPKYAMATGETLLHGYKKMNTNVLVTYFILSIVTMFTIQTAVTIVTAGLAIELFGISSNITTWAIIITILCLFILIIGRYKFLDNLMKFVIILLTISTIFAVFFAGFGSTNSFEIKQVFPTTEIGIAFLAAFMGWMPAPLDISVWQSVWTVANNRKTKKKANLKETLFDFKIGFFGTLTLAIMFLSLGAFVLFNQGEELSNSAVGFSKQLISVYTNSLGSWSFYIISIAALTTMFSTAITCLDAFPRVLRPTFKMLFTKYDNKRFNKKIYTSILIATSAGSFLVIMFFMKNILKSRLSGRLHIVGQPYKFFICIYHYN